MLNEDSHIPLYRQLNTLLLRKIESGEWPSGYRLPTEAELCREFSVSRMTVRLAVEELKNKGLLYRKQGKGTFVTSPKIEQKLSSFYSFGDDMEREGHSLESRVLSFRVIPCPEPMRHALGLAAGEPVYAVERVRGADGVPFAHEISYLPCSLCEGLTAEAVEQNGLYRTVKRLCGLLPDAASESFEAILVGRDSARLLEVPAGGPALRIERIAYAGEQAVEYCSSVVRGDRLKYKVFLHS